MSVLLALLLASTHLPPAPGCYVHRDWDGRIARSREVVAYWRETNPCPSTGRTSGRCPGYEVNHKVPLFCGGADAPRNLEWLTRREHVAFHRAMKQCPPSRR